MKFKSPGLMALTLTLSLLACSPSKTPGSTQPSTNPSANPSNPAPVAGAKPQATSSGRGGGGNTGGKDESGSLGSEKPANQATGDKTLFAVYLLGSDLEDDVQEPKGTADEVTTGGIVTAGAGSDDLREMTATFKALSAEERAKLDVVVGFGGARKQGWKGIKYTDANCIVQDSADNYFGNDSCYLAREDNADMGKAETSAAFVKFLNEKYPAANYARRMFVFWDHGGAHKGYGPDTNTDTAMTLKELHDTFAADPVKWDLIGFDTCLMGSLDVVPFVRNNARYMLASEELEPGHGWQYTEVLNHLAKNPSSSIEEVGKFMVNSFVTSESHKSSDGKTLSLLNLSHYDEVMGGLSDLSGLLKSGLAEKAAYEATIQSAKDAESYGKSAQSPGFSMDIKHFLGLLKEKNPSANTDRLSSALDKMIVASQQDGTRPKATGLAIFQINNKSDVDGKDYKLERAASPQWFDFITSMYAKGGNDTQAPQVQPEAAPDASTQSFKAQQAGAAPSFKISDDLGLKSVLTYMVTSTDQKNFTVLGSMGSDSLGNQSYRAKNWDGKALRLCTGTCTANSMVIPVNLADLDDQEGTALYVADGQLNGEDSVFYFEIDGNGQVQDYWVSPYATDNEGDVTQISREQYDLGAGDQVEFYYNHFNIDSNNGDDWKLGEAMVLGGEPSFQRVDVAGEKYTFLVAEDLKGNVENSDLYPIK